MALPCDDSETTGNEPLVADHLPMLAHWLIGALVTSVLVVIGLTGLLWVAGRRPTSYVVRLLALLPLLLAPLLPVEATATMATIALVALVLPRHWYAVGAWLFGALLMSFGIYGVYLVRASLLLGGEPLSLVLGLVLLGLQLGAMALLLGAAFELVDAVCAPPVDQPLPPDPARWPLVCLQVPTYNEPPDLVIETLRSLVALDYPALRVQVIDNNTVDEGLWRPVAAECKRLRRAGHAVDFVHLPEWPGYKGGALNWGLAHLADDVEVVGVVDADYVVDPSWLRRTVPHFTDPQVAFVQTPQDYRAWETSAFYRACYVGFAYFFKVGMVSRARRNAIIFAGTMGLISRAVLEEVGGWDERIITEDAEISLRVLARGYRSVYVLEPMGRGIMPLTYEGLRKQRFRWAFGGIQILRRHWRTLFGRGSGLTLGQRYDHLMGGLWWFNDALTFGFALFVAAAALGAIAGRPFVVQLLSGLGLVLPLAFIGLNLIRYLWGLATSARVGPTLALAALRVNLSLSWVIALACVRGLSQERGVFLRTPKFQGAPAIRELRLVWIETVVCGFALVLLALVVLTAGYSAAGLGLAGLLGWSALIYGSATTYALGDPTRAPVGHALREKARLELAPRIGRVARSRPAQASVGLVGAVLTLLIVVAFESGRAPVGELPFDDVPAGPIARLPEARAADPVASPTPSAAPSLTPGATVLVTQPTSPREATPGPGSPVPGLAQPTPTAQPPPAAPGTTPASPPQPTPTAQPPPAAPGTTPAPPPQPTAQPPPAAPGTTPAPPPQPTPTVPAPSLVPFERPTPPAAQSTPAPTARPTPLSTAPPQPSNPAPTGGP